MNESEYEELEPSRGHMAPLWARRLFGFFGVNTYTDGDDDPDEE